MDDVGGAVQSLSQRHDHTEIREWYERALADGSVGRRSVRVGATGLVHLLETGAGRPVVLLHGTGVAAGFFLPLLANLDTVHAMAPDLPGRGLSDPIDPTQIRGRDTARYRGAAVAWVDRLLDALELDTTALLGHSAGGLWAMWYAIAHPERVERLVLIGPPALPKTRCPLPYRLLATPVLGQLLSRVTPPSRDSALRFARFMGEGATLASHPDLVDLFVAAGRDSAAAASARKELSVLVSRCALLSPSGFRRQARVRPDELRQLRMPTQLLWGDREPLGNTSVAQAVTKHIARGRLELVHGGHAPWLGRPAATATTVQEFLRAT